MKCIISCAVLAVLLIGSPRLYAEDDPFLNPSAPLFSEEVAPLVSSRAENFEPITGPIHILEQLRGLFFQWRPEFGGQRDLDCFVAGDLSAIPPEVLVWEVPGQTISGVHHDKLAPIFVEAIKVIEEQVEQSLRLLQSLAEQFTDLEGVVRDQGRRLDAQQREINALQTSVAAHETSLTLLQEKQDRLEARNQQLEREVEELRSIIMQLQAAASPQ